MEQKTPRGADRRTATRYDIIGNRLPITITRNDGMGEEKGQAINISSNGIGAHVPGYHEPGSYVWVSLGGSPLLYEVVYCLIDPATPDHYVTGMRLLEDFCEARLFARATAA